MELVDIDQLAEILNVDKKWIYERTSPEGRKKLKKKGEQPLPLYKMGKYNRSKVSEVETWLEQFKDV